MSFVHSCESVSHDLQSRTHLRSLINNSNHAVGPFPFPPCHNKMLCRKWNRRIFREGLKMPIEIAPSAPSGIHASRFKEMLPRSSRTVPNSRRKFVHVGPTINKIYCSDSLIRLLENLDRKLISRSFPSRIELSFIL